MRVCLTVLSFCIAIGSASARSNADEPFLGPTVDVEVVANQKEYALGSSLLGDDFREKLGDRSKLPTATAVDLTLNFVWGKGGLAPPIPPGGEAPPPKVGVRNIAFEVEGPGVVHRFSDVKASGPMGRRPGEKLVSNHTVSSLEEVRLEKVDGRLRGYKKSYVYLTEPGTYTIKARVTYAHMRHIRSAMSQPVTIKVTAAETGDAEDKAAETKPDTKAAAKPKPDSNLKYVFVGKLKSSEQYFAGRGAAAGRFPSYKLRFEVVEVREGDLKVGQVVPCDQSATPRYKTPLKAADVKVGEEYFVGSPYKHPAHAEGLYLLECRLAEFPVRKEGGESTPPKKEGVDAKPTGGRAINLNNTASGKTVSAGVGDLVIVELDANPSTGFAWVPEAKLTWSNGELIG